MAYLALYRLYRPQIFADVVGQEHITQTLKNQIVSGRIAHAYLFCGSRGTGKTSTAKIFARAVNCTRSADGEPCGQCDVCGMDAEQLSVDIIEIDAASNNGVDEIRDLRDKVHFAPAFGKHKVYIIDEVHMLSAGAFNALLKTLEEPPAHVVFILATTEPQKLPATIVSRCQRFDFRRIPEPVLMERMREVLVSQGQTAEPDALAAIARAAQGGMRDALSLLDQCLGFAGGHVTAEAVAEVMGAANSQTVEALCDAVESGDLQQALTAVGEIYDGGRDMTVLTRDMIAVFRDRMISRGQTGALSAMRAVTELSAAEYEMRQSPRPRVCLEAALVKLCMTEQAADNTALLARIEKLEQMLQNGVVAVPQKTAQETPKREEPPKPRPQKEPAAVAAAAVADTEAKPLFDALLKGLKAAPGAYQILRFGKPQKLDGDVLTIAFPEGSRMKIEALLRFEDMIQDEARKAAGRPVRVEFTTGEEQAKTVAPTETIVEKAQRVFNMQVEIED